MLSDIDKFYFDKEEPVKSCLLALREIIIAHDPDITTAWKYRMPFFLYKEKMFCYLWVHKKNGLPYIGIVEGEKVHHPKLIVEKRERMKIILFDPTKDLPVKTIQLILKQTLALYKSGKVTFKNK